MDEKRWNAYIGEILSFVKFRYDHKAIRRELTEHMEDLYEDLQAEGMDAPIAEQMTMEYMGQADEIGEELNRVHSPILGWVWWISRAFFMVVLLLSITPLIHDLYCVGTAAHARLSDYPEKEYGNLLWSVDAEERAQIDDLTVTIDKIRFYDDGEMQICFSQDFSGSAKNGYHFFAGGFAVSDENGNRARELITRTERIGGGGDYMKWAVAYTGIPADAETLYLDMDEDFKNTRFEVSLCGKEAAE